MLPNKTKYRKYQKGGKKITGIATACNFLSFGLYGIKSLSSGRFKSNQIESARRAISKKLGKVGKLFVRVFPDIPVSSKPAEVRMGSGKGSVSYWMCRVKPGTVLFEVDGVSENLAIEALYAGASKLPFKTKIIKKII